MGGPSSGLFVQYAMPNHLLPTIRRPVIVSFGICCPVALPQSGAVHGIDLSSLDRGVVLSTHQDLCRISNAGWIAKTHLRPYQTFMTRNNELVYKTLTDPDWVAKASAGSKEKGDNPTNELVHRFYRATMDEKRADALRVPPLRPEMAKIDAIRDVKFVNEDSVLLALSSLANRSGVIV